MALQLSPYFKAISKQRPLCPECGYPVVLNPLALTWDAAVWKCKRCKWFQTELAPDSAKLGPREPDASLLPEEPKARIIRLDFGNGG